MWIIRVALNRPYTFIVLALLILLLSPVVISRTPADIFPNINIPVIAVSWTCTGLNPEEMEGRIASVYERLLTTLIDNIEHIESTTVNGTSAVKIFLQPNASIDTANAQVTAASQTVLRQLPAGTQPPLIISYRAKSQLETAHANYDLAKITSDRWQLLLKSNSVSKQETDQAVANQAAQKAVVDSNSANVRHLEQLQSFEKVYAPFNGVITVRSTDIGALINAGSAAQSKELFHLAAISTLRVFVPVPEVYSNAARPGAVATLTLDEYPGRVFRGTLVRDSSAIDPASRTLLVEVDVSNSVGLLLPGAYVSVHLKLPATIRSVLIPANTLLFRHEGLRVGVVRDGRASLVPVAIGRDYGANVEIVSGLLATDSIILDPSDSLENGSPVHVRQEGTR